MKNSQIFDAGVRAFEGMFNCRLCLHDFTGIFRQCSIPRDHLNPYCTGLKKRHDKLTGICIAFDCYELQQKLETNRKPFYKICPCGFLEAVIPLSVEDKVCGVLFAGPFAEEKDIAAMYAGTRLRYSDIPSLPRLQEDQREYLLDLGMLLGIQLVQNITTPAPATGSRRELIEQFIRANSSKPIGLDDLAECVGLSAPRASELVKKLFGEGFNSLLIKTRIRQATKLLEHSAFNIETVAHRCGFTDSAYFHRVFKKSTGETPCQYRRRTARAIV